MKEWHRKEFTRIPDRRTKRPEAIGNLSWAVALRPGTAGKTSNPASGKDSFMFVRFWALTNLGNTRDTGPERTTWDPGMSGSRVCREVSSKAVALTRI